MLILSEENQNISASNGYLRVSDDISFQDFLVPIHVYQALNVRRGFDFTHNKAPAGVDGGSLVTGGVGYVLGSHYSLYNNGVSNVQSDYQICNDRTINSFRSISGTGPVLWGQFTFGNENSVNSRINVRTCVNNIKYDLKMLILNYIGQNITDALIKNISGDINTYLSGKLTSGEIYDFTDVVISDKYIDLNGLVINVGIAPTETLEIVELNIESGRA